MTTIAEHKHKDATSIPEFESARTNMQIDKAVYNAHGPEDPSLSHDASSIVSDLDSHQAELPFDQVGLIGRSKELRLLRHAFNKTFMGTAQRSDASRDAKEPNSCDISGDSSIGKSLDSAEFEADAPKSNGSIENDHSSAVLPTVPPSRRTLVLIPGHSGSGKTALAMQVKQFGYAQDTTKRQPPFHGFFACGKCEISEMNAEQPYAGIKSALRDLCNQILCLPRDEQQTDFLSTAPLSKMVKKAASMTVSESTAASSSSVSSSASVSSSSSSPTPSPLLLPSPTANEANARSDGETGPSSPPEAVNDPRRLSILREKLKQGMTRGEILALSNVIPELPQVVYGVDFLEVVGDSVSAGTSAKQVSDESCAMSVSTAFSMRQHKTRPWTERIGYRAHGDRLKFALQKLIQIVCSYRPLVFVVDDLQWADKASLDILKSWMFDTQNSSLMVIGCYRSNLLEENDSLKATLTTLEESKRERSLRIVNLPIQDLELHHINEMLCRLLGSQSSNASNTLDVTDHSVGGHCKVVEALADVVHKKTGGNPLFIQRFLQSLVHDKLLRYNASSFSPARTPASTSKSTSKSTAAPAWKWTWDDDEMKARSPTATTVLTIMKNKLKQVTNACQILPIAACLGASFSYSTISIVMRGLSIHSAHSAFVQELFGIDRFVSTKDIGKMLRACEREGLLEKSQGRAASADERNQLSSITESSNLQRKKARGGSKKSIIYNFSHDKVQEAALDLVEEKEQLSELKYRVGEILLFGLPEEELDQKIFMVTNLVNSRLDLVPDVNKGNRGRRVTMLNFHAGTKAVSCSAFQLASIYFKHSIDLLPNNHWDVMSDETLEIYSAAAECAFVLSNLDQARRYCTVITESKCDTLLKIDAYQTLIDVAMAEVQKDTQEASAVGICMDVLSQLGCKLPKPGFQRMFHSAIGLIKLKHTVSKITPKVINDLRVIDNEKEDAILRILGKLTKVCYFFDKKSAVCVMLQIMRRTLKYGVSEHSPSAFLTLSVMTEFGFGNAKTKQILGQRALDLMEKMDNPSTATRIIFNNYSLVQHWKRPLEDMRQPFLDTYRMGMSTGDVDTAAWSVAVYIGVGFATGTPLDQIDADCATYSRVLLDFHQSVQYAFFIISWQQVLNLRGASMHRTLLIGDAFDESTITAGGDNATQGLYYRATMTSKMALCSYFGKYEEGAKLLAPHIDLVMKDYPSSHSVPPVVFLTGLCCLVATQSKKGNRLYRRTAQKCRKQLKAWSKQGHPNCPHYIMLLDAEHKWLHGNLKAATELFTQAIQSASERGYINDQALANERLGDCWMERGRDDDARSPYEESIRLYQQWGATRKVEDLKEKVDQIFQ